MEQARSTISKIFNGEPHTYTRFNLTQNMEGDTSQVEMKLSSDVDEEVGENGVGDHRHHHNSNGRPYMVQKLQRTPRNLCYMVCGVLLIFIIGLLIGYMINTKKEVAPVCASSVSVVNDDVPHETGAAPLMDWDDVKKLLTDKFSAAKLEKVLSEFSQSSHRAGSPQDESLANRVLQKFKVNGMKTWTDEHFIKVHDLPAGSCNEIIFKNTSTECTKGFLSYSSNGSVKGAVLYAHYGEDNDFQVLLDKNINMSGRVMLIRAGKISFAEKVANAARMNASAVLIYLDPSDYNIRENIELYGHVHMGSGDPYTPGFPSFNHTQFPPAESSGLPKILAQTITLGMAKKILNQLSGPKRPDNWEGFSKLGDETDMVTVEVKNVLTEKRIHNVFGVIKGFVDPDRYMVIGAQRDAWGPGYAASTVGTSILVELARSISDMVKNEGFKPRRSIVFASWSAGEYGSIGATEWLEGYLSSLSMKAFSYINLDGVVTGLNGFKVAASPLMHTLIENALKEVKNKDVILYKQFAKDNFETNILEPMRVDSAAYPFLAFSGIPSMSFRFSPDNSNYKYFGTMEDTAENLNAATSSQVPQLAETAGRFAGHIALRLVHDHLLQLDVMKYYKVVRSYVTKINGRVKEVLQMQPQLLPKSLTVQWLISATGSYSRAAQSLQNDIQNSDLEDIEMCRLINDRIMAVERNFLSHYVSPKQSPFRHILLGSGPHTLKALTKHLDALKTNNPEANAELFLNEFALATWTIQGCANSLAGDIWSLDNEI
ncbi:transferrin receptor protein 1-like [Poeciliopsis prolifica]|uniref:transferrin receptor protein 1-like n=1 Tax=Poeciliopsis prolifica TaxID=188132 RepID=UPI00241333B2|nr:transferrin receptor protein 1-like [Poeciliopsis prolifica]